MNRITNCSDWWDGPLAGRCVYEGRDYAFRIFALGGWIPTEDDSDACYVPRIYRLYDALDRLAHAVFEGELEYDRIQLFGKAQ
jgi:hypothetical protein